MTTDNLSSTKPESRSSSKNKNRAANQAAIALISEHYPEVFNRENVRPLKIGIQEDLVADEKLSRGKIKRALASYVRSPHYYKSLQAGAERIDLNGEAAGTVTEQEAEHAKSMLKKIRDARNERIKNERQQQKQQREQVKQERFNDKLSQLLQKGR
ncbi:MAG: ProQ/FinO family protein [Motiliproteus sp.]|nr:ProQ/FinO family protein [Motiliproteus sp.]MCW9051089.1 ProQ/FinO family protein [Motiliproteus sp.]